MSELTQWRRDRDALDRLLSELWTIADGYTSETFQKVHLYYALIAAATEAEKAADILSERIKAKEATRAMFIAAAREEGIIE